MDCRSKSGDDDIRCGALQSDVVLVDPCGLRAVERGAGTFQRRRFQRGLPAAMTERFRAVFGERKPVIGMVHFGALPGAPLYDSEAGLQGLVAGVAKDLAALQQAGFDAV